MHRKEVMVSVIMPVYNVKKYLQRAVDSVLGQSLEDYEIILVDDGSTDGSGELCDLIKEQDDRIVVIHKENGGVSSARNAALDVAVGKYIYFMDPDDYFLGELLADNIGIAEEHSCSQVVFGFLNVICSAKENKEIKRIYCRHNLEGLYDYENFKQIYKEHLERVNQVVWNRIYRRDCIGNIRFSENLNTAEDAIFNMNITKNGFDSIYYNNECYYVYICRQNSLMNKYNPKRFENEMLINDFIKNLVDEWGVSERLNRYISKRYVESVLYEYGNMSMHDCQMKTREIIERIRTLTADNRVSEAITQVCSDDFGSKGLKILYNLTEKKMYILALMLKRIITPVSLFMHNLKSLIVK